MKLSSIIKNINKKGHKLHSITFIEKDNSHSARVLFVDENKKPHSRNLKYSQIDIDIDPKYFSEIKIEEFGGEDVKGKFFQTLYYNGFYVNIYVISSENKNIRR